MSELDTIRERNARVEADKAWEVSWTRRIIIAGGTYLVVCVYLTILGVQGAMLHALVPPGAYLLSTLTLPVCKRIWLQRVYKKGGTT